MSTTAEPPETAAQPTPWSRAVLAALAASAIVTVVLLAFLWPTASSEPKDLPIGVVATAQQYDTFRDQVDEAATKSGNELPFTFTRYDTREEAVTAIKERDSYGAFVLPAQQGENLEVLTASAASPAVATMLKSTGGSIVSGATRAGLAQAAQQPAPANPEQAAAAQKAMLEQVDTALAGPQVTDVVPLSSDDAQGTGLAVASLPLTIGGIVGGMLLANLVVGTWRRLVGIGIYAIVGGIAMVLILDTWFGFAPAPTFELWGAITLSLAATVGLIVGLHSAIGAPGLGIGALITMLIGNPISAAQSPKEFLPGPFGEIGQFFVPGATGTLVRDLSYFPDANTLHSWLVLAGWVALGIVLTVIGHHRTGGHGHRGGKPSAGSPSDEGAETGHTHRADVPAV